MVLLKPPPCAVEDRQAVIAVSLRTSSPTLSLSAPEDPSNPFQVVVALRIVSSCRPGQAITICTRGTVLEHSPGIDMLAQGAFSGLINTSDPSRNISLGLFRVCYGWTHNCASPDLTERGMEFVTVPGDGSEARVVHDLSFDRMFRYEKGLKKEDLTPGERYKIRMYGGYIGTLWWCWGDLEGDLKDRKLCAWHEGDDNDVARPTDEEVSRERWVLGEDVSRLWFEDRTEGGYAEFEFVGDNPSREPNIPPPSLSGDT